MVRLAREEAAKPPKPFIYRNPRNAAEVAKAEARPLVPCGIGAGSFSGFLVARDSGSESCVHRTRFRFSAQQAIGIGKGER
jgi:hypothetical protein